MKFENEHLTELSALLTKAISLYEADRDLALQHYQDMKKQLVSVLNQDFEMSQDGILESELNKALKLVFESSKKLDKVIFHVANVVVSQLNNESREKIADKFQGGGGSLIPNKPVDFARLRGANKQSIEYNEEDED